MGRLTDALTSLIMLGDDVFLRMQVTNLAIVDAWLSDIETALMQEYASAERTPLPDAVFLSAQSQMWIFAAYELLRTWRERIKKALTLVDNGGLQLKINALRKPGGLAHLAAEMRARQLERLLSEPSLVVRLRDDLRRAHIPFKRMEALRITLAKHEVVGRKNVIPFAPGYGRIDRSTGSITFEISSGRNIYDEISRRDVAEELRAIFDNDVPGEEELARFDEFFRNVMS